MQLLQRDIGTRGDHLACSKELLQAMISERLTRIRSNDYPADWRYYTLTYPVADYKNLSCTELMEEVNRFTDWYYSYPQILWRMLRFAWNRPRSKHS